MRISKTFRSRVWHLPVQPRGKNQDNFKKRSELFDLSAPATIQAESGMVDHSMVTVEWKAKDGNARLERPHIFRNSERNMREAIWTECGFSNCHPLHFSDVYGCLNQNFSPR
jgi:hypothetical protein